MASVSTGSPSTRRGRPSRGWVRKNLHIDQRKLDAARRVLGVKTETETVDAALDAIALRDAQIPRGHKYLYWRNPRFEPGSRVERLYGAQCAGHRAWPA